MGIERDFSRKFVPLHRKISLRTAFFIFAVSLLLGWFCYSLYRDARIRHAGQNAVTVAVAAAAALEAEGTPPGSGATALLNRIGQRHAAENIYLLGIRAGNHYPLLASTDPERPAGAVVDVDGIAAELGAVFVDRLPRHFRFARSPDIVSGFAPLFDADGRVAGVVGVDAPLRDALGDARSFGAKTLAAALVLAFLASVLVSRLIRTRMGEPVDAVIRLAAAVADGNPVLPDLPDRDDELGLLGHHIRRVVEAVNLITMGANRLGRERDPDAGLILSTSGLTGKYLEVAKGINKAMTVMDGIDSVVYVTDPDNHRLLYFNRKFASLFKIDAASARNRKCWEIVGDGVGPCPHCVVDRLRAAGADSPGVEWEHFDKRLDAWLLIKESLVPWIDGGAVHLSEGRDISVRKEFEKECARQERAARDAARDALDASEMKSTFLATMSHEIRTPMNGIIGFADLAQDDAAVPDATRNYLDKIKESAQSLLNILDDILDIAKIESGDTALESVPFRVRDVFDVLRAICQPQADEKGLTLYFYAEPFVEKCLVGDPARIRRILLCFLTNAIKFTERGEVKVKAIVEKAEEDGTTLYFEVRDTGIGMTPEEERVIFDPFTQADGSVTRKYGGVGVGLSIAKSLIEGMGGTLEMESAPGVGSRFGFRLTFRTVDAPAETVMAKAGENPYKTRKPVFRGRILVCEDNAINQEVIAEHLAKVGLDAVIAENGRVGVDTAAAARREGRPFDLVLMDIHMPVMGGLEASRALAESGETMPVVALTANIMPHDRELYRKYGLAEVLGKPFKAHELWSCLARYLTPVDFVPLPAAGGARAKPSSPNIDRRLGLERSANNAGLYERLRDKFLKANRDFIPRLRGMLDAGDNAEAHRMAHSLKSSLGMVGADAASEAAAGVEAALAGGDADAVRPLLDGLESRLSAVLDELERDAARDDDGDGGGSAPAGGELDAAAALELLDRLIPLLRSGKSECMELLDEIRKNLSPLGPDCAMLMEQMDEYDFDPACETAERMRGRVEAANGRTEVQHTHRG